MSVTIWSPATDLDLNVSNVNFVRLLDLVGVDREEVLAAGLCGSFDGDLLATFVGKVRFALESMRELPMLDGGTPTIESVGAGGCRVIECGLPDGYYTDRLARLLAIAEAALHGNRPVHFG